MSLTLVWSILTDCAITDAGTSIFSMAILSMENWRTREIVNEASRSPKRSRLLEGSAKFLRKAKIYFRTLLLSWLSNRSIYRSHSKHMSCLRTSSHPVLSLSPFAVIFLLHSAFFFSLALSLSHPFTRGITMSCHDDRSTLSGSCCIHRPREIPRLAKWRVRGC